MDKQRHDNEQQADLAEVVKKAILSEMRDSGLGINVAVREGIANLWGIVDVLAEKLMAEKIAQQVYGVEKVDNDLTVAMDNFISDKDINELVQQKLASSTDDQIGKLGAETRDGIVYLQGHASNLGIVHEAQHLVAGVRAVKDVRSEIKVGEGKEIDDASITNAVERAISISGLLDVRKITTSTTKGVVQLQGMVDTISEIEMAVDIAYQIPGVKAVQSDLKARHGAAEGDRALTNQLRTMLSHEKDLSLGTLRVHVVNGMAFLAGEVFDIDAKQRAEEVTRQLSGITGISNTIQVSAHNLS